MVAAPPTAAAPSSFGQCDGQERRLFTQEYRIPRRIGSLVNEFLRGRSQMGNGVVCNLPKFSPATAGKLSTAFNIHSSRLNPCPITSSAISVVAAATERGCH
jgi:hypothetical protein